MTKTVMAVKAPPTPAPPHVVGRCDAELSPDEKLIFENALILILKELHAAFADAYNWLEEFAEVEGLAQGFNQGKKSEAGVTATLASLASTGFIAASKNVTAFVIRWAG